MIPTVSVITTVYNGEAFLSECINSVIKQTFRHFEMIVVNDGSSDATGRIMNDFKDSRVRCYHERRMGRSKGLNLAISRSRGKYIAILDADDIALPDRLEESVGFMESNRQIGVISSGKRLIVDESGDVISHEKAPATTHEEIMKIIPLINPMFNSSCMYKQEVYEKIGGYRAEFFVLEDYDFFIRAAKYYEFANIPFYLSAKRRHEKQFFSRGEHWKRGAYRVRMRIKIFGLKNFNPPKAILWEIVKCYVKSTQIGYKISKQ